MRKKTLAIAALLCTMCGGASAQARVVDGTPYLLNQSVDVSTDFRDLSNTFFYADRGGHFQIVHVSLVAFRSAKWYNTG